MPSLVVLVHCEIFLSMHVWLFAGFPSLAVFTILFRLVFFTFRYNGMNLSRVKFVYIISISTHGSALAVVSVVYVLLTVVFVSIGRALLSFCIFKKLDNCYTAPLYILIFYICSKNTIKDFKCLFSKILRVRFPLQ